MVNGDCAYPAYVLAVCRCKMRRHGTKRAGGGLRPIRRPHGGSMATFVLATPRTELARCLRPPTPGRPERIAEALAGASPLLAGSRADGRVPGRRRRRWRRRRWQPCWTSVTVVVPPPTSGRCVFRSVAPQNSPVLQETARDPRAVRSVDGHVISVTVPEHVAELRPWQAQCHGAHGSPAISPAEIWARSRALVAASLTSPSTSAGVPAAGRL